MAFNRPDRSNDSFAWMQVFRELFLREGGPCRIVCRIMGMMQQHLMSVFCDVGEGKSSGVGGDVQHTACSSENEEVAVEMLQDLVIIGASQARQ